MENMQYSDALGELIDLNKSLQCTPGTTTITSSTSIGSQDVHKYHSHFTCQGASISSPIVHQLVKVSVPSQANQQHHRYITKILNSPRKAYETPLCRMRPYFIPEQRSRTKSESLETSSVSTTYPEANDDSGGEFPSQQSPYATCTTTTYSMVAATQMDTTNPSRAGLIQTHCNTYEDEQINGTRKIRQKKFQALKKSRSLEDVRAEAVDGSQLSHEMEFVSSRIQKLKVQE